MSSKLIHLIHKNAFCILVLLTLGLYTTAAAGDLKTAEDPFLWTTERIQGLDLATDSWQLSLSGNGTIMYYKNNVIRYMQLKNDGIVPDAVEVEDMDTIVAVYRVGDAIYCAGRKTGQEGTRVVKIPMADKHGDSVTELPALSLTLVNCKLVHHGNTLYILGNDLKEEAAERLKFFKLDLMDPFQNDWVELKGLDAMVETPVFQGIGQTEDHLFALAGEGEAELWSYDFVQDQWTQISTPADFSHLNILPVGASHLMFISSDISEGNAFYSYHTVTGKWTKGKTQLMAGTILSYHYQGNNLKLVKESDGQLYSVTGTPVVYSDRLVFLDYVTLTAYFLILVLIGLFFSKRNKNLFDYFKGGKRVPWFASGISIVATKLSAISFIAFPAKAYAGNLLYMLVPGYYIVAAYIIPRYYIPFISKLDVTSVYEYLEARFNPLVRTVGSITFSIYEIVRMGVLFLAPAIMMSLVLNVNIYFAILIMGLIATIYTYLGGLEAVIWTDVLQVVVMFGGALIIIIYIFSGIDQGFSEVMGSLSAQGKLKMVDPSLNLVDATLLVFFLSWIGGMKDYMANQTVVQRLIATKNEKEATKSIFISGAGGILIVCTFLFLGTALFVFYQNNPERLVATMDKNDSILPWFIIKELPVGVTGLLVAAVFAAAMSSLDSAMNSVSSLFITDIYNRYFKKEGEERSYRLGKVLTIVFGVFGTLVALVLAKFDIKSLIDQFFAFLGLFGSGLGGLFVLGLFTKRANSVGALTGFIISGICQYLIQGYTDLNVFVYLFTGMMSCVVFGYLISLLSGSNHKDINGLTVYTLKKHG